MLARTGSAKIAWSVSPCLLKPCTVSYNDTTVNKLFGSRPSAPGSRGDFGKSGDVSRNNM